MLTFFGHIGPKSMKINPFALQKSLTDNDRFKYHYYKKQNFFLAFSNYNVLSQPQLPAKDQTGKVSAVATGHLYEWADGSPNSSEAELSQEVLQAYLKKGIGSFQGCKGNYSIGIIDMRYGDPGKLFLLKDRLGYSPLYYHCDNEGISFASRAESIGVSGMYKPELDADALIQALYLGIVLEEKSFFRDVRNIPGGKLLTYENGKVQITDYSKPIPWPERPADHYLECVDNLGESIKQAVRRQGTYCKKPIKLLLSGGTESRLLLGCLMQQDQNFHAVSEFDYSPNNDPDVTAAKKLQKILGFNLVVAKNAVFDVEATTGMLGKVNSDETNAIHTMKGLGGTTDGDRWNQPREVKNMIMADKAFGQINPFTSSILSELTFDPKEMSAKYIERRKGNSWEQKAYAHNFDLLNGSFLKAIDTDTHARPQNRFLGNLHLPYLDEDLVIVTAKIPPMLPSVKIKMFMEVFKRYFPELATVSLVHKFESKRHQKLLATKIGDVYISGKEVEEFPFRNHHEPFAKEARNILENSNCGLLGRVVSEACLDVSTFPLHFSLGVIFWDAWKKLYFPQY
jgi:hypothetical protein